MSRHHCRSCNDGGPCGLCEETPTALQSVGLFFKYLNGDHKGASYAAVYEMPDALPDPAGCRCGLCGTGRPGGQAPDIPLGFYTIQWVDWWTILLGIGFVLVTLFAPEGIGGLVDKIVRKEANR